MSDEYGVGLCVVEPHDDDAARWAGGLLCAHSARHSAGLITLTDGSLSSRGTIETRRAEARNAGKVLGISEHLRLEFPDGGVDDRSPKQLEALVTAFRTLRPEIVVIPGKDDLHPDHVVGHLLCLRAIQAAGLIKYGEHRGEKPWVPRQVLQYPCRVEMGVSLVVDVTGVYEQKLEALACYGSQTRPATGDEPPTGPQVRIASPLDGWSMEGRDRYYGATIRVRYAEPYLARTYLPVPDVVEFFRAHDVRGALYFPQT